MTRSIFPSAILFVVLGGGVPAYADGTVPAVGCPTDGQQGPKAATKDGTKHLSHDVGAGLAYYHNAEIGVLGPRGWHCLVLSDSNGTSLYVSPEPLDAKTMLGKKQLTGDAIQLSVALGETSGRFEAAKFIARLFPQDRVFVDHVIAEKIKPASHFVFGPYPTDRLTRKSEAMVEYETPAGVKGLGTDSRMIANASPISGMVFLGEDESVTSLSVRLSDKRLTNAIIRQTESDRGAP